MSRNQPPRARKFEDYRHHTICEWLLPAHRVFGDIGRDVTFRTSGHSCETCSISATFKQALALVDDLVSILGSAGLCDDAGGGFCGCVA